MSKSETLSNLSNIRSRLLRGGVVGLIVRVLGLVIGFLSSVVIVRLLGAEEYGRYAFAITIITVLAMPSMLGQPTLLMREIAGNETSKNWARMSGIRKWSNQIVFITSLVICLITVLLVTSGLVPVNEQLRPVLLIGLLLVPLFAFIETFGAKLMALHRVFWGQFPKGVMLPSIMLIGMALVYTFLNRPMTAMEMILLQLSALILVLSLSVFLVRRHWPADALGVTAEYASKDWLRALLPLSVVSGLQIIYNNTDLLLIGVLSDTTSVGTYRIALSIATVIGFGISTINLVIMPHFANLHKQGDWETIWKISRFAGLAACALTAVFCVAFALFGQELVTLIYGADQALAYMPTVYLTLGLMAFGYWSSLGGLSMMTGQENRFAIILVGCAATNIVLNLLLIPDFHIEGAAAATAISYGINGVLLKVLIRRPTV